MVHWATCFFLSEMVNVLIYAGRLQACWSGRKSPKTPRLRRAAAGYTFRQSGISLANGCCMEHAYRGVRRIGDKSTGSRRRFVFSLSQRGTSGERAGERGKP